MIGRYIVVIALACFSLAAQSTDDSNYGVWAYGVGIYSCGSWIEDERVRNELFYSKAQWVWGYLSAMNDAASDWRFSRETDAGGRIAFISKYCRENPLETIKDAAFQLWVEIGPAAD